MEFLKTIARSILKDEIETDKLTISNLNKTIDEMNNEIKNLNDVITNFNYQSEDEKYYETKYPKANITYKRSDKTGDFYIDVRTFIQPNDFMLPVITGANDDEIALNSLKWVMDNIKYTPDKTIIGLDEYWMYPHETYTLKRSDCVAEYEEIYTKDGIKKAKDIKVGDLVLSYDFDNKAFVFKPIVNVWDKGIKKIFRVHFRNGQSIDVTEEHNLLVRNGQSESNYIKQQVKDIDLSRWWKRKVPISVKIPYEIKDIPWLNEDLCLVLGHYLAEGWKGRSYVCSSGYELTDTIIPLLEKNEIPFSEYTNNSGVPCINFLKSEFKDFLKRQKENSFDIHLTEELFHLPENKLKKILEGIFIGDGNYANYPDKRGFNSNKEIVYSTSSEQLARDIQRIGLQIGVSYHIWKQEHHGGLGKEPIYRITFNPESHFLKDHGYKDISEVSISYIEEIEECQTYDWEVQDTHNFVFKNGIISHNCEDGSVLLASIMIKNGIKPWKIRVTAGNVVGGGHCFVVYYCEEAKKWVLLDWCFVDNKRTKVSTPKGLKRFSKLKVGEEVISFNEKTKKIETSVIEKIGKRDVKETYRIYYLNANGKKEYVECTKEHPFFIKNKWVNAENINIGDEIYAVQPRALFSICGNRKRTVEWQAKITESNRKNGTFIRTSERQTNNNTFCRLDVRKKLSENNCMKNTNIVEKVFSKRMKEGYKSQPEVKFIEKIEELNLPVSYVGDGSFWVKGKNPDFKVDGEKKVIEVTQYGYLGRDEKWARERIKHFENNGFKCFVAFYDKKLKLMCSDKDIVSFVMNGFKVINVKKLNKKRTVWNIHCSGNNNYFVNGMLVHNCYWPNRKPMKDRPDYKDENRYLDIWFSFNNVSAWGRTADIRKADGLLNK